MLTRCSDVSNTVLFGNITAARIVHDWLPVVALYWHTDSQSRRSCARQPARTGATVHTANKTTQLAHSVQRSCVTLLCRWHRSGCICTRTDRMNGDGDGRVGGLGAGCGEVGTRTVFLAARVLNVTVLR